MKNSENGETEEQKVWKTVKKRWKLGFCTIPATAPALLCYCHSLAMLLPQPCYCPSPTTLLPQPCYFPSPHNAPALLRYFPSPPTAPALLRYCPSPATLLPQPWCCPSPDTAPANERPWTDHMIYGTMRGIVPKLLKKLALCWSLNQCATANFVHLIWMNEDDLYSWTHLGLTLELTSSVPQGVYGEYISPVSPLWQQKFVR